MSRQIDSNERDGKKTKIPKRRKTTKNKWYELQGKFRAWLRSGWASFLIFNRALTGYRKRLFASFTNGSEMMILRETSWHWLNFALVGKNNESQTDGLL